jgi:hypothetical protein
MRRLIEKAYIRYFLRSKLSVRLGRYFYRNNGGLLPNLIGKFVLLRDQFICRRESGLAFAGADTEWAKSLRENGYFIKHPDDTVDISSLECINDIWLEYLKDRDVPVDGRLQLTSASNDEKIEQLLPHLEKVLSGGTVPTLEAFYQCKTKVLNFHIYRIFNPQEIGIPSENAYGSTSNWHTDGSTTESLKIFFMLSDITPNDGPMQILNREESRGLFGSKLFGSRVGAQALDEHISRFNKPLSLTGKKGTMFVALTNECLHRASLPDPGRVRDLLTLQITCTSRKVSLMNQLRLAKFKEVFIFKRLLSL